MLKQKCPYRNDTETWKRPINQKKKKKKKKNRTKVCNLTKTKTSKS